MIILLFAILLLTGSCVQKYRYLSEEELKGVTLESHHGVYKLAIQVRARADCYSILQLNTNFGTIALPVHSAIDTVLIHDWYGESLEFNLAYDSCFRKTPQIGIRFIDGY